MDLSLHVFFSNVVAYRAKCQRVEVCTFSGQKQGAPDVVRKIVKSFRSKSQTGSVTCVRSIGKKCVHFGVMTVVARVGTDDKDAGRHSNLEGS